jgi:hypothetical protein
MESNTTESLGIQYHTHETEGESQKKAKVRHTHLS